MFTNMLTAIEYLTIAHSWCQQDVQFPSHETSRYCVPRGLVKSLCTRLFFFLNGGKVVIPDYSKVHLKLGSVRGNVLKTVHNPAPLWVQMQITCHHFARVSQVINYEITVKIKRDGVKSTVPNTKLKL